MELTRGLDLKESAKRKSRLLEDPQLPRKRSLHHKHKLNKRILALALGVISVLIIVIILLLVFVFKVNASREEEEKGNVKLYLTDGGEFIEEEIQFSDNEVHINVYNVIQMIFDFKNGLLVERFVKAKTKMKTECFTRPINASHIPSRDSLQYMKEREILLHASSLSRPKKPVVWISTHSVSSEQLSESVKIMCRGTNIYMTSPLTETEALSKGMCSSSDVALACFNSLHHQCVTTCFLEEYCSVSENITKTTEKHYCRNGCKPVDNSKSGC